MKTFRKSFIKKKLLGKASAKAQSAMEYLMTYGWAILIIGVVLAALYQLGVFNPMTFAPKAPPGSCQVFRPDGPGTTSFINLEGICSGELPQYVAQFNGYKSYIQIQSTASGVLNTGQHFTVTFWIKTVAFSSSTVSSVGMSNLNGNGCYGYNFFLYYNGYHSIGLGQRCTVGNYGNITITPGNWYFVAGSYAGSGNLNTYIDAAFSDAVGAQSAPFTYNGPLEFGCGSEGYCLNGNIANVQIYNTSLSANEIQALYLEGIGGAPIDLQNLVGWWPLNGNANDYSGNGNNGQTINVDFISNWYNGYTPP